MLLGSRVFCWHLSVCCRVRLRCVLSRVRVDFPHRVLRLCCVCVLFSIVDCVGVQWIGGGCERCVIVILRIVAFSGTTCLPGLLNICLTSWIGCCASKQIRTESW